MSAPEPFGRRLVAAAEKFGPLCVGIDPHPHLLHSWGLSTDVAGLREFSLRTVAALDGTVGVVKPQSAFYEQYGSG
ncbi:MAG TPA: orotidine 5'-phosphate decarboxylase, partial [Ruania sp.]|nr:orotidine 5'-phosphate decarboxylase [Ruania sp.]